MNTALNKMSECWGLFADGEAVGFLSVMHFPHPIIEKAKRTHRLVILPDYQGVGLGNKFESFVAGLYKAKSCRYFMVTSARNMIYARQNSKDWKCIRWSIAKVGKGSTLRNYHGRKVKTATFEYIGKPIYAE